MSDDDVRKILKAANEICGSAAMGNGPRIKAKSHRRGASKTTMYSRSLSVHPKAAKRHREHARKLGFTAVEVHDDGKVFIPTSGRQRRDYAASRKDVQSHGVFDGKGVFDQSGGYGATHKDF
jgi:hypothetical protein